MPIINPDDIVSALWVRLDSDTTFKGLVNSIDKGPKRRKGYSNPAATIHMLTAPVDPELDTIRCTAVVNVYADNLVTGQMDSQGLGLRAARVQHLFHRAHEQMHPEGAINDPYVDIKASYVSEPLVLPSEVEGEHLASVRLSLTVEAKEPPDNDNGNGDEGTD